MNLPARELMRLEDAMQTSIVDVMNGLRRNTVMGDLAGTWLAVHLADPDKAGPFEEYEPHVMHLEWRKAKDPKDELSSPKTSVKTPTVALDLTQVPASDT